MDADAEFLFAPRDEVRDRAAREEAIPFDVPRTGLARQRDRCGLANVIARRVAPDPAALPVADTCAAPLCGP